jgi:hypothetical protein
MLLALHVSDGIMFGDAIVEKERSIILVRNETHRIVFGG